MKCIILAASVRYMEILFLFFYGLTESDSYKKGQGEREREIEIPARLPP